MDNQYLFAMKIIKHSLSLVILGLLISGLSVQAQSKKEIERKKEKNKQEVLRQLEEEIKKDQILNIEENMKALQESKILQEKELKALFEDQQEDRDRSLKEYQRAIQRWQDHSDEEMPRLPQIHFREWPSNPIEVEAISDLGYLGMYSRSKETTSLNISKAIEDLTFDTKFKYEVQEGSKDFHFGANGTVNEGTILIRLINPDDDTIHEFEISPLADVKWSQVFKWDKEDADDNYGTWTIEVSAKQATGKYNVSVRAN